MNSGFTAQRPNYTAAGALLFVLFVLLYVVFLGIRPLFIPDEVRYGEIAREMLATGDWIVPRLNGLLYFEKPPLGHWLNAISLFVFGENAFAVRLAGAASVGVSAIALLNVGRLYLKSKYIAYLGVFVFLTMFEVQAVGTFAVLDSIFSAVLNAGIAFAVVATMKPGRQRYAYLVAAGLFFGLSFLTKGFLALLLPAAILAPWFFVTRQYRLLFVESWIMVAVAMTVVAPWSIAIHLQQPDFWRYFFWVEHVQRFMADNAQHKEPPYYYLMYLPIVAFPWIFFAPAAVLALRKRLCNVNTQNSLVLLTLWSVVPFIFFSVSSGKLITYILPCFLPLSLLIAAGIAEYRVDARAHRIGLATMLTLLVMCLLGTVYANFLADNITAYRYDEHSKLATLMTALFLMACTVVYALHTSNALYRIVAPGVTSAILLCVLPFAIPQATFEKKAPVAFIREVYAQVSPDTEIVTNGSLVRAVSWATGRTDVYVVEDGGETTYGLAAHDADGRFLLPADLSSLLSAEGKVLLICKGQCREETMNALPVGLKEWEFGNFFAYFASNARPQ